MVELLKTPRFLSELSPGIHYRFHEWIEDKEVMFSDVMKAAFSSWPIVPSKVDQPDSDVRKDDSLYVDIFRPFVIVEHNLLFGLILVHGMLCGRECT